MNKNKLTSITSIFSVTFALLLQITTASADDFQKQIQQQIDLAQTLAKRDASGALDGALFLCQDTAAMGKHIMSFYAPIEPTQVFDDLFFVGTEFVGVWVLQTSAGLMLFDSMGSSVEAAKYVEGGLAKLGLNPAAIKLIVVTHGHWDHYGGARYLQMKYGARVVMGKADADLMELLPEQGPERMGQLAPKIDVAVTGAQDLLLGNTTVKLIPTPGHSAGTLSALLPVSDHGKPHKMALWGGTALPPTLEASHPELDHSWHNLGLLQYRQSLQIFREWVGEQGGDGIISTHPFAENTITRAKLLRSHPAANPYVLGRDLTQDYFFTLDHCVQAAMFRAHRAGTTTP